MAKGPYALTQTFLAQKQWPTLAYQKFPCFLFKNLLLQAGKGIVPCKAPWKYTMHIHRNHYVGVVVGVHFAHASTI